MSAGTSNDDGSDLEINLAPIIDCFTVLITYLLVSTSFLTVEMLDVNVAANAAEPPADLSKEPPVTLTLLVAAGNHVEIKVGGGAELAFRVPASQGGGTDFRKLEAELMRARKRWPEVQDISVTAEGPVKYRDLVHVVENVKPVFPKVTLGE